jgi:hypothetical protein
MSWWICLRQPFLLKLSLWFWHDDAL